MKTEVEMKRELFGFPVTQKSKSEFFSATDLARAGSVWRLTNGRSVFDLQAYFAKQSTKEFIKELEKHTGEKVKIGVRGRGKHTWVHPFLFIDIALAISPVLKIEVYEWLFDKLIAYRNDSGDSFKKMAGSLYVLTGDKKKFTKNIKILSSDIKDFCKVNDWQIANEEQLKLRDRIHENITLLCDVLKDPDEAIRIAFEKSKL